MCECKYRLREMYHRENKWGIEHDARDGENLPPPDQKKRTQKRMKNLKNIHIPTPLPPLPFPSPPLTGKNDCSISLGCLHYCPQLHPRGGVQSRAWLVHVDHQRIAYKGDGYTQSSLHPPAVFAHALVAHTTTQEVDRLQGCVNSLGGGREGVKV